MVSSKIGSYNACNASFSQSLKSAVFSLLFLFITPDFPAADGQPFSRRPVLSSAILESSPAGTVDPVNSPPAKNDGLNDVNRSEEHTSELQSLMRISYAVFCLKKKTTTTTTQINRTVNAHTR